MRLKLDGINSQRAHARANFHPEWGYTYLPTILPSIHMKFGSHAPFLIDGCRCGRSSGERNRPVADNRRRRSFAARTLVPSGPEVTAKPSELTSAKVPSPEQRELPPSTPTQAKAETVDMSADPERPDSSKINAKPSLLQRHIVQQGNMNRHHRET